MIGSPIRTTSTSYTDHTYAVIGYYTLTVIVNDGLEDSASATATVEIVQAPTEPPFGALHADLTPNCGAPGETVTITMGEFAQFQWWNFGTMGALPSFPPRRLPLGLSAPDGLMPLTLPGGQSVDVPFQTTLLGPGRYIARATFVVPDLGPGVHDVSWAEAESLPFRYPARAPDNREPRADAGGPYAAGVGSPITFDGPRRAIPMATSSNTSGILATVRAARAFARCTAMRTRAATSCRSS